MTKRFPTICSLLMLFFVVSAGANSEERPRIGLALSGGGAKGFAHIGVLKVLEEVGIPIDYITGTSMGSIVGGLYSIGYSVDEIEGIALNTDWARLFSDRITRRDRAIEQKLIEDRYLLALPIVDGGIALPRGLIAGQKISLLLSRLTLPVHDQTDFSAFPTPFACVATDIETGEAVVLNQGFLAEALRASMSIPSVFTPVEMDDHLLVDGMLVRNFPVQDVIDMGAEIVIGVDVGASLAAREELESFTSVLGQALGFMGAASTKQQRELCDILIVPDIEGVGATDFRKMKEIIDRGEQAARSVLPHLQALADDMRITTADSKRPELSQPESFNIQEISIEGMKRVEEDVAFAEFKIKAPAEVSVAEIERAVGEVYNTGFFERVTYKVERHPNGSKLIVNVVEKTDDLFRMGLRYDTHVQMSAIINVLFRNAVGKSSLINFDVIVGERHQFLARGIVHPGFWQNLALATRLCYLDDFIDFYQDEKQIAELGVKSAYGEILVGATISTKFTFGAESGASGWMFLLMSEVRICPM